jgi:hypothetical protein
VTAVTFTLTDQDGRSGSCSVEVVAPFQFGVTAAVESNSGLAVSGLTKESLTIVNGDLILDDAWVAAHGNSFDRLWVKGHCVMKASTPITGTNSYIQGRPFSTPGSPPYTAIVHARSTGRPVTAVLNLFNSVVTAVQPDVNIVSMSGERLGTIERNIVELGSDLINVWDNDKARVRGNLLRRPTFWDRDAKHETDTRRPWWSHNDGYQNNGGSGAVFIGNTVDMHCDPVFGNPETLIANGYPNLDYGCCVMLSGSNRAFVGADVWGNRFHGGVIHVQMPFQSASNPAETGNSWEVHHNGHTLTHPYSGGVRQFVAWGWGKGPTTASVHDEYLLAEGNVPTAIRGSAIPAAVLQGSATPSSGQYITMRTVAT